MYNARIIKFTTTGANEDLLQNSVVKAIVMERIGATTDAQYQAVIDGGTLKMRFDIYFSATNQVKINDQSYNDLLEDIVYSSSDFTYLKTLKIKTACSGTLYFEI